MSVQFVVLYNRFWQAPVGRGDFWTDWTPPPKKKKKGVGGEEGLPEGWSLNAVF